MSDFKLTKDDLHHLPELIHRLDQDEGPSFLAVVILAGIALMCILLVAMLFLGSTGTGILPRADKPDYAPTSMLVMPAAHPSAASSARA